MASRITLKPGHIFRFPTSNEAYGYCQCLPYDVRFFLISTPDVLSINTVIQQQVAFRVPVFRDTPRRYAWVKIGEAPFPDACGEKQTFAKQDSITKKIFLYRDTHPNGEEIPASYEEVAGLETCAVWAHPHIVERLLAQISGVRSKFLESVRVKPFT